jgi:hypothetical protein
MTLVREASEVNSNTRAAVAVDASRFEAWLVDRLVQ